MKLIEAWPVDFLKTRKPLKENSTYKQQVEEKLFEIKRWLHTVGVEILPHSLYDKGLLVKAIQRLEDTVWRSNWSIRSAKRHINESMNDALGLIKAIPASPIRMPARESIQKSIPRTAFILMWMEPSAPELDDVCNAIKEVCNRFGVYAVRADDVEHQDRITDVVLQKIAESEFLIVDLTGERPNVYYEVGYAHALNKRPILYRKQGTRLHFDLSVHNVPEYKNITELKDLLNRRFEAILGHKPRTQFR